MSNALTTPAVLHLTNELIAVPTHIFLLILVPFWLIMKEHFIPKDMIT